MIYDLKTKDKKQWQVADARWQIRCIRQLSIKVCLKFKI